MRKPQEFQLSNPLPRQFYTVPALQLAFNLLGCLLVSRIDGMMTSGLIVETEAYLSTNDPGSHTARGQTPRTSIQWGAGGYTYVYLIYGMYHCLNIVADQKGTAGCVLIRALEPVHGISIMRRRRPTAHSKTTLTNGPGKLTTALGIDLHYNAADLTDDSLCLYKGTTPSSDDVTRSTRIGLKEGIELPYRFYLTNNPFVSR